jgi:hypothetical protein
MIDRKNLAAAQIQDLEQRIKLQRILVEGLRERGHSTELEDARLSDMISAREKLLLVAQSAAELERTPG